MHDRSESGRGEARGGPRVLRIALDRLGERGAVAPLSVQGWGSAPADLARLASWSGSALAAALLLEHARARRDEPAPLVLSVGECVRRGVPTAARASVASRAPLTGLLAEGQVGSDLARRLASVADALVIEGRASVAGAVLQVSERGARLHSMPELAGCSPRSAHERIEARLGSCATLAIGPAGERGSPCASLAASSSSQAGGGPPHFVGRGGLGAVLGRCGLKALAVSAPAVTAEPDLELIRSLVASPRLARRSQEGTLELFEAFAARGELDAAGSELAARLAGELETARRERRGCEGCPTPCGWTFQRRGGSPQHARFGASRSLALELGLAFEDALELLAACDEAGLDAKEIGAGLSLLAQAWEARGDRERLLGWIGDAARGEGQGALLARGCARVARELGLEASARTVKGAAVRPDRDLPSLLGQCVSARGVDPLRSFPFLVADGAGRERLESLLERSGAPWIGLPAGAEDPHAPQAKGRIVWWHENLSAALDLSGFCAFSAGALLGDRALELDELASRIAPEAARTEAFARGPARELLRLGEELVAAQRELNRLWGWHEGLDRPEWAGAVLDQPGMLDEYRALRAGAILEATPAAAARSPLEPARARGRVRLHGSALPSGGLEVELPLPATASDVLAHARRDPALSRDSARGWLPALYREGRLVQPDELVRAGERLDAVLVVSGG